MYAALTTLTVSPGMWVQMAKSTDQLFASIKTMKGFKQAIYFGDDAAGIFNSLVIWDSKQNAEAAQAVNAPKTQQGLASVLKAPPTRHIFEIYEPKV